MCQMIGTFDMGPEYLKQQEQEIQEMQQEEQEQLDQDYFQQVEELNSEDE